jgi:hypothetical protein
MKNSSSFKKMWLTRDLLHKQLHKSTLAIFQKITP